MSPALPTLLKTAAVALPFTTAVTLLFLRRHLRAVHVLVTATALLHLALALTLATVTGTFQALLQMGTDTAATKVTDTLSGTSQMGTDTVLPVVILLITSILFLISSSWAPAYLSREAHSPGRDTRFFACLTAFLGTMSLVVLAEDLALVWVAVEATTLVSAPLICYHSSKSSLEAMWKYLLLCSIGIALALLATMMLGLGKADPRWYKAAFVLALCGYGTKMGLAPFHMWLPDAHSESPAVVSGLLSGALLNCSFVAVLRFRAALPPDLLPFCSHLMLALGLASLAVAAVFIVRQTDYKRMLAYSSVEHIGLITVLFALNLDAWGLLHITAHSLLKMCLFLAAGELLHHTGTRRIAAVSGLFSSHPALAAVWTLLVLLICAAPPSPLFFTELALVRAAPLAVSVPVLVLLFIVFAGMTHATLRLTHKENTP